METIINLEVINVESFIVLAVLNRRPRCVGGDNYFGELDMGGFPPCVLKLIEVFSGDLKFENPIFLVRRTRRLTPDHWR